MSGDRPPGHIGTSRLWLLAAALIAGGAVLEGAALALYWRPCAGQMLNGSILQGYRYASEFSPECLVAMDQASPFPLPEPGAALTVISALGAASGILLAAAWLVLLPALRLSWPVTLVAALPGILGLALVANAVVVSFGPVEADDQLGRTLMTLGELSVGLAVLVIGAAGVRDLLLVRAALVALAATSTGLFHQGADYMLAGILSDANWDVPPGSGYATVATALLIALASVVLWWRDGRATPSAVSPAPPSAHVGSRT